MPSRSASRQASAPGPAAYRAEPTPGYEHGSATVVTPGRRTVRGGLAGGPPEVRRRWIAQGRPARGRQVAGCARARQTAGRHRQRGSGRTAAEERRRWTAQGPPTSTAAGGSHASLARAEPEDPSSGGGAGPLLSFSDGLATPKRAERMKPATPCHNSASTHPRRPVGPRAKVMYAGAEAPRSTVMALAGRGRGVRVGRWPGLSGST